MVNRGEEKVRVHMNVVPRSTKNTNGETEKPRSKDFFFTSCGSLIRPLLGLTPSGLFMGLISTLIYTSELILCFTINVGICCVQMLAGAYSAGICCVEMFRSSGRGFTKRR